MLNKKNLTKISIGFLMLLFLVIPQLSYAYWGVGIGINIGGPGYNHYYRYHDRPQYGWHIHYLPERRVVVLVHGTRYFYYDGLYYTYVGQGDYILVNPPVGAFVNVIPADYHVAIINGRTYYTDNGVYYILTRHRGYKVVVAPVVYAQPAGVVVTQSAFPVNVPNNAGGYTTVVIKRSGNGFLGPQGEFYAQFPTVVQLKVMYSR